MTIECSMTLICLRTKEKKKKRDYWAGTIEEGPFEYMWMLLYPTGAIKVAACIRWLARQSLWHEQLGIHNWTVQSDWLDSGRICWRVQWHIPLPETAICPFPVWREFSSGQSRATLKGRAEWYRQRVLCFINELHSKNRFCFSIWTCIRGILFLLDFLSLSLRCR